MYWQQVRMICQVCCILALICLISSSLGSVIKDSVKCIEGSVAVDDDDCASYFQCIDDETVHLTCPNGSYFEGNNEICIADEFGICPTSLRKCLEGYLYEDFQNCASYLKCLHGNLVKQVCPLGSYFNVVSKSCSLDRSGSCSSFKEICVEGEVEADPDDCAGYLECESEVLVKHNCSSGSYFEPIFKLCQVDENGVCPSSSDKCTEGEVQVDPDNCAGYLNCQSGKLVTETCPSGTYFEPTYKICTVDLNGVCVDPPAKCTEGQLKIDPNNCAGYLKCVNGEMIEELCPSGSFYDPRFEACVMDTEGVCLTIKKFCIEGLREEDPNDCTGYTLCIRGELENLKCESGRYFNVTQSECLVDLEKVCLQPVRDYRISEEQDLYTDTTIANIESTDSTSSDFSSTDSTPLIITSEKSCIFDLNGFCVEQPTTCIEGKNKLDPSSCAGYLKCISGKIVKEKCPYGSFFDSNLEICSLDIEGVCVVKSCIEGVREEDPEDCSAYNECIQGEVKKFTCAFGSYFNETQGDCLIDVNEVCIKLANVNERDDVVHQYTESSDSDLDINTKTESTVADLQQFTESTDTDFHSNTESSTPSFFSNTENTNPDILSNAESSTPDFLSSTESNTSDLNLYTERTISDLETTETESSVADFQHFSESTETDFHSQTESSTPDFFSTTENANPDILSNAENSAPDFLSNTESTTSDLNLYTESTISDLETTETESTVADFQHFSESTEADFHSNTESSTPDKVWKVESTTLDFLSNTENTSPDVLSNAESTTTQFYLHTENAISDLNTSEFALQLFSSNKNVSNTILCVEGVREEDPQDCAGYIHCIQGESKHLKCDPGRYFNLTNNDCLIDVDKKCVKSKVKNNTEPTTESSVIETTSYDPFAVCKEGQLKQNPSNCAGYLKCKDGELIEEMCSSGFYFDPESRVCLVDVRASCVTNIKFCIEGVREEDPNNCAGYRECVEGAVENLKCPSGKYFNVGERTCLFDVHKVCLKTEEEHHTDKALIQEYTPPMFLPDDSCALVIDGVCVDPLPKCIEGRTKLDPNNCAGYLKCKDGALRPELCPNGSYYDTSIKSCSVDRRGICVTNIEICDEGAREEDPQDCAGYRQCIRGEVENLKCPPGTYFNVPQRDCLIDVEHFCVQTE